IADGAVMPGPVGTNPSLTIAAMADRMCTRLLEQPRPPPAPGARGAGGAGRADRTAGGGGAGAARGAGRGRRAGRTSLSFTEEMRGTCPPALGTGGVAGAERAQP